MFKHTAEHFSSHALHRQLLFFGLALLAITIHGYHFGTFDQVFHITFLKKFVNPNLYPGDPFLSLRWYHFSYFWFGFIPALKAGILEIVILLVHLFTIHATLWMFWVLSETLFKNHQASLLLVLALAFPHIGLPGFQIIEFSLLNRTFVLPFLLGAITLYLKGKKTLAFLIVGMMYNLHVIYATFVLCMFLMDSFLRFKFRSLWRDILGFLAFLLAAAPVILWRSQTGSGIDLTLRPEILDLSTKGLLFTVYYPIGPMSFAIGNFLAGVGSLWAYLLGDRAAPQSRMHSTMRHFAAAIGVVLLIALVTSYWLPITILIQMQLLRAAVFMLYFGMVYLSFFLVKQFENGRISSSLFSLLATSFILLISPIFTIFLWELRTLLRKKYAAVVGMVAVVLLQAIVLFVSMRSRLWAPGFYLYGPQSDWQEAQEWARENTPLDATFITPPHIFWHYVPDWRVFSERSSVVTIPEMMEIPFDPGYAESFKMRFEALAPGALAAFNGNYMQNLEITRVSFYTHETEDFRALGCQFSANYLVLEKPNQAELEIAYQNDSFWIYRIPDCQSSNPPPHSPSGVHKP